MTDQNPIPAEKDWPALLRITHLVYGLQSFGLVMGWLPAIIGVILNYVKLEEVRGSWLEGHYKWQIKTFWWGMLWYAIGAILCFTIIGLIIGWPMLIADAIWILYRVIKGWLNLNEKKPI